MLTESDKGSVIYFDNAATSFPKPPEVLKAVLEYLQNVGANPGRSGHRLSAAAGQIVFEGRKTLADFFGLANPMHVVFTANATEALNIAIGGVLKAGDHVLTSSMEHNSTIRPLHQMKKTGLIDLKIVPASSAGKIAEQDIIKYCTNQTRAIIINHVSNVNGCCQPIRKIGEFCRTHDIIFIVDAAQSAGIFPLDLKEDHIDLLAVPGHKSLYGPTGTGALLISDDFDLARIRPLKYGGTGSLSDSIEQPDFLPDKLESGTLNVAGIAGLTAGIKAVNDFSLAGIRQHKHKLYDHFLNNALMQIPGFQHFNQEASPAAGVIAFRLKDISVSETAQKLSDFHNIMCRHGLHCAPLAHQTLRTFPCGTLRFSFGIFNKKEEIDKAVAALKNIAYE